MSEHEVKTVSVLEGSENGPTNDRELKPHTSGVQPSFNAASE